MPKLQEYRDAHYTNTGKVSDNVRALSIAAIGIVWIFKSQNADGSYEIPEQLYYPVLLVFIAMAFDFIQYVYGSIAWGVFFRLKENNEVNEDSELYAPPSINWPTYILFYGKVIIIGFAYFYLTSFLIESVKWE